MSFLSFSNIGITGICSAVPSKIIDNLSYTDYFKPEDVKEIVSKTGILERRFAPEGMCASDLCFAAANRLLDDMKVNREEIDLVIFISQTPDYRMPATSVILQHRLGLSSTTAAFDMNLGCSAFVYGLSVIYSFMMQGNFRKALLLDGETRSRIYSPKDRQTAFLFGDGGVAALIEKSPNFGDSWFSLNSDGSRESLIKVDAGGYRNPSSASTLTERVVDEFGNIRSDEHGYMNGADVFNFVLREIPKDINALLNYSKKSMDDFDYFVFHQANAYMNSYLAKKLKIPVQKAPSSVEKFGNTSSVSIPLTITTVLKNEISSKNTSLFLCGFGVGMSWASAIINMNNTFIGELVEVA